MFKLQSEYHKWMKSKIGICGGGRRLLSSQHVMLKLFFLCQNSKLTLCILQVNGIINMGVHSEVSDVKYDSISLIDGIVNHYFLISFTGSNTK